MIGWWLAMLAIITAGVVGAVATFRYPYDRGLRRPRGKHQER
jgi:hypothetical protein